jgi:hypothetical protein
LAGTTGAVAGIVHTAGLTRNFASSYTGVSNTGPYLYVLYRASSYELVLKKKVTKNKKEKKFENEGKL